jgi:hypothetical protein
VLERSFVLSGQGETIDIMAPPGFPWPHVHAQPFEYGAGEIAPLAAVAASEVPDPTFESVAVRGSGSPAPAAQTSSDINRAISVASVDPLSSSAAQRLTAPSAPRFDTLVGLSAFRVDALINQGLRNPGAATAHDPEVVAALLDTSPLPASLAGPLTLPRAEASENEAEGPSLALPVTQQGSGISMLPSLNVTALERAMQNFLRQLQGTGDELAGKHDKAGLGVWLVAGSAAVAACEIARRQMRASRAKLAVEWNWIAGVPPEPPFGQ